MKTLLITTERTIFFYFFVMLVYRLMGKREIGQLGVVDLIVSILMAELVALSIENTKATVMLAVVPIIALTILQVLFDYVSLKFPNIKEFLDGKPSLIIDKGKVNYKEMVKQRYSIDDLLLELRQKGIKSLENIDYAFLEQNGKLSIFKKNIADKNYPMPLIADGKIKYDTLKEIRKSRVWLEYMLMKNHIELDDVFYGFYKGKKLFVVKKDDLKGVE